MSPHQQHLHFASIPEVPEFVQGSSPVLLDPSMVKQIRLEPLSLTSEVDTYSNLLSLILSKDLHVLRECNGRGLCATCHIYVAAGMESLTPMTTREKRTLEVITSAKSNSRLACQSRVVGDGVVVELPPGMYVNSLRDIEVLIGRRADDNLLHPVTGKILVEQGKLITRSTLKALESEDFRAIGSALAQTSEA